MHQCSVVCISIEAAVSLYLKFCRSSPIPPTMTDNQAYGTKMTYDPAYGPITTYNEAYGPITTYNEAYGHIDPEYVIVDDIQHGAPPRPSPIPAVKSKDQTSPADHTATD